MYPWGYIWAFEGIHLRLAIEGKNIFIYHLHHLLPSFYTYISEYYFQKSLYEDGLRLKMDLKMD